MALMTTIQTLDAEQKFDLKFIPETETGYHYVYICLRDKRDQQLFRVGVTILQQEELVWPLQLGAFESYSFICFLTMRNDLAQWFRVGYNSFQPLTD